MNYTFVKHLKEWFTILIITSFIAIVFASLPFINFYALPWLLLFLFLSYRVYLKLNISHENLYKIFLLVIFGGLLFLFLSSIIFRNQNLISKNYVGVYGFEERGENDYGQTVGELTHLMITNKTNLDIQKLEKLDNKYDNIGKEEFLFWQTGVTQGYEPLNIKFYDRNSKILNYFSFGLISFIEIVVLSIEYFIYGFLGFLIWQFSYRLKNLKKILTPITMDH